MGGETDKQRYGHLKHKYMDRFTEMLRSITSDEAFSIGTKCLSFHPSIEMLRAGVKDDFDPWDVAYYVEYRGNVAYFDDETEKDEMEIDIESLIRKANEK